MLWQKQEKAGSKTGLRDAGLLGQAKKRAGLDFHGVGAESMGGMGPGWDGPTGRGVPWSSGASGRVFMTHPDNERFLDHKTGKIIHEAYISCDMPVIYWENSFSGGRRRGESLLSQHLLPLLPLLSSSSCLLSAWPRTAFLAYPGPWGPPPTSWLTTPSSGHSTEDSPWASAVPSRRCFDLCQVLHKAMGKYVFLLYMLTYLEKKIKL